MKFINPKRLFARINCRTLALTSIVAFAAAMLSMNFTMRAAEPQSLQVPFIKPITKSAKTPDSSTFDLRQPLTIKWRYESAETIDLSSAANSNAVFVPLTRGQIISLRALDGVPLWRTDVGGEFRVAPLADEENIYVATQTSSQLPLSSTQRANTIAPEFYLRALSSISGITAWSKKITAVPRFWALAEGKLIVAFESGDVLATDKSTGAEIWRSNLNARAKEAKNNANVLGLKVKNNIAYLLTSNNLTALNINDGTTSRIYQTPDALRGVFVVSDTQIFVASQRGYLYALNQNDSRVVWRAKIGTQIQSLICVDNYLIAVGNDNFVYCYSIARGARLWKRRLAGRVTAQPLAIGESVYFAPLAGDSSVVLDAASGRLQNLIVVGDDNNTSATPVVTNAKLIVTTRKGVLAFASSAGTINRATNNVTKLSHK